MIKVSIFPLALGEPAMFERTFAEPIDADRYEAFWRALGCAHVRRVG